MEYVMWAFTNEKLKGTKFNKVKSRGRAWKM